MIALSAAVGNAQSNNAGDVALVQACLKLATDKKGRAFYDGIANGIGGKALWSALARFLDEAGFGGTVLKPGSQELRVLVTSIPGKYRFMRAVGRSSVLHIPKSRFGPRADKVATEYDIPFPGALSKALAKGFRQAVFENGLSFTVRYDITNDGRFSVTMQVRDSQWVDPTSLRLSGTLPTQLKSYVANAVARPSGLFKLEGGSSLTIVSKKAYPLISKSVLDGFWAKYAPATYPQDDRQADAVVARCKRAVSMIYFFGGDGVKSKLGAYSGCFSADAKTDPTRAAFAEKAVGLQFAYFKSKKLGLALLDAKIDNERAFRAYIDNMPARKRHFAIKAKARGRITEEAGEEVGETIMERQLSGVSKPASVFTKAGRGFLDFMKVKDAVEAGVLGIQYIDNLFDLLDEQYVLLARMRDYMEIQEDIRRQISENNESEFAIRAARDVLETQSGIWIPLLMAELEESLRQQFDDVRSRMEGDKNARGVLARFRIRLAVDQMEIRTDNRDAMAPVLAN